MIEHDEISECIQESPYDFAHQRSEIAYEQAASKGCVVVVPEANQLFVDIDCQEDRNVFSRNIEKVAEQIGLVYRETPSPSGTDCHSHVVIDLDRKVTPMERILLQTILGSDRVREALSWIRLINEDPTPTLFFEKAPLLLTTGVQ